MPQDSGFTDVVIGEAVDTFGGAKGGDKARAFEVYGYAFMASRPPDNITVGNPPAGPPAHDGDPVAEQDGPFDVVRDEDDGDPVPLPHARERKAAGSYPHGGTRRIAARAEGTARSDSGIPTLDVVDEGASRVPERSGQSASD
jgi:hypothetical protein